MSDSERCVCGHQRQHHSVAGCFAACAYGCPCPSFVPAIPTAPTLLQAAAALLRAAHEGMTPLTAEGVRSLAFGAKADQMAAAWRDLKAAVERERVAPTVTLPRGLAERCLAAVNLAVGCEPYANRRDELGRTIAEIRAALATPEAPP